MSQTKSGGMVVAVDAIDFHFKLGVENVIITTIEIKIICTFILFD